MRQVTSTQIIANSNRWQRTERALPPYEQYKATVRAQVEGWKEVYDTLTFDNWAAGIRMSATVREIQSHIAGERPFTDYFINHKTIKQ